MNANATQDERVKKLETLILQQKARLDTAVRGGDPLNIELATDGLNSLLEQMYQLLHVTKEQQ